MSFPCIAIPFQRFARSVFSENRFTLFGIVL